MSQVVNDANEIANAIYDELYDARKIMLDVVIDLDSLAKAKSRGWSAETI